MISRKASAHRTHRLSWVEGLIASGTALVACGTSALSTTTTTVKAGSQTTFNPYATEQRCSAPGADGKPAVYLPLEPATRVSNVDNKIGTGLGIVDNIAGDRKAITAGVQALVYYTAFGQLSHNEIDST